GERVGGGHGGAGSAVALLAIVGMRRDGPVPPYGGGQGNAGVVLPCLVDELADAVGPVDRDQHGNRVEHRVERLLGIGLGHRWPTWEGPLTCKRPIPRPVVPPRLRLPAFLLVPAGY